MWPNPQETTDLVIFTEEMLLQFAFLFSFSLCVNSKNKLILENHVVKFF